MHLNLLKLVLYCSHYPITSKFEAAAATAAAASAAEIMAEVLQHQYPEVKMDCKTTGGNSSKRKTPT